MRAAGVSLVDLMMAEVPDPLTPCTPANPPAEATRDSPTPQSNTPDTELTAKLAEVKSGNLATGVCTHCGYQLAGLPASGQCPECKTTYGPIANGAAIVPAGFLCYKCGYGLVGLPADGECPECSTPYALSLAFRGKPHPGQFALAIRVFWPVAAGLASLVALVICSNMGGPTRDLSSLFSLLLVGAILLNVVNLPITSSSLSARYVPPHRRRRWSANMFFLGPWVGTAWVLATTIAVITVALPVLAFGACLVSGGFR